VFPEFWCSGNLQTDRPPFSSDPLSCRMAEENETLLCAHLRQAGDDLLSPGLEFHQFIPFPLYHWLRGLAHEVFVIQQT